MNIFLRACGLGLLVALGIGHASDAVMDPAPSGSLPVVSRHHALFTKPPVRTPVRSAVDGPLMGNGDLLVALGGSPDRLRFFINKNDLWRMDFRGTMPMPLASIGLTFPELAGATYQVDQDLLTATTSGRFATPKATLSVETRVMATENLLWMRLSASGGTVSGKLTLDLPEPSPLTITGGKGRTQIGREQHGGGRWYLPGSLDEIRIHDRCLSAEEIASLSSGQDVPSGLTHQWSFEDRVDAGSSKGDCTFVPGRRGKALHLDGKTGYVDVDPWRPGTAMTVSAFIRLDQPVGDAYIISNGAWNDQWSLGLIGGRLRIAIGNQFEQSEVKVPVGEWVHVAGTCDGRSMAVYINGRNALAAKGPDTEVIDGAWVCERRFEREARIPTGAACVLRRVGGRLDSIIEVRPDQPVVLVAAVDSRFHDQDFRRSALSRAQQTDDARLDELAKSHQSWWSSFWNQSSIAIPDAQLEQRYYLSQYVMASASRDPEFPPGIFGWVTTDNSEWGGVYFLNYNYLAPFYALYASNHIAQADPCSRPFVHVARRFSEDPRLTTPGTKGIYQSRTLGPMGSVYPAGRPTGDDQHSPEQKCNGGFACANLAAQWYATYDLEYGRRVYPYVLGVATFWEHWLKYEDGQYNDYFDPIHEESGCDVNPILSLGLVRMIMDLAIDMSTELGVDADRREKWQHIRTHLAPYTPCRVRDLPERFWPKHLPQDDRTLDLPIFRYTAKGTPWWQDGVVGLHHVVPGNAAGLDSPADELTRLRNMVTVYNRWIDFNGMNTIYAAAARVGYDPKIILAQMKTMLTQIGLPNGMIKDNPHGMEHQSIVPHALQEMLFQSHEGVLRMFPCWPRDMDATFTTLRARGAFLVSAALRKGAVGPVTIISEKGRPCIVQNPWPGQKVQVNRGQQHETVTGDRFTLQTTAGETLVLSPIAK